MPDAAVVFAAVVLVGAVVLVARERVAARERLLAENRLAIAELSDRYEREQVAWRHERAQLLNRIQAPEVAVGEAYAEADELRRTQAKGEPRVPRVTNYRSEHADGVAEHAEHAAAALAGVKRELEAREIPLDEIVAAAKEYRAQVEAGAVDDRHP